jgi:hypothetical protein
MIEEKDLNEAIDRIARSHDGHMLYLFLQRKLMGVSTSLDDGALRVAEGERLFALRLMSLMTKGIEESGGRSESICTFAVAGARVVSASRGAGRRVTLDTFIPGYDNPDDAKPAGNA